MWDEERVGDRTMSGEAQGAQDTELLPTGPQTGGELVAGRYRLMSLSGVGGTADVWRAHDERRQRTVTLKILRERDDPAIRRAFLAEAEILDSLTHAGIIPVLGIHDTLGITAIVFAHVEGESLAAILERRPFGRREVAGILIQLAGALASLHRRGFIHLDLKPANILYSPGPRVRLLDFGIAEPIGQAPQRIRGTPRFVAPEIRDGAPATPASDVYGLAIVARELLGTGSRGPRLSQALDRALSPDPADRHRGTRSFATAFAYAVLIDDEIAAVRARIARVVRPIGGVAALARLRLPAAPRIRPRAALGTLVTALWVMAVAFPPYTEVAAVTGRETAPAAPLVAAAFELPPLAAYGARFEAQAPYPTVAPAGRADWVVALRNTGSAGWYRGVAGAQASLVLDDGSPVAVQTTSYVGPGQVGWFVARLSAPRDAGTHVIALHPKIDGRGRLPELGIQARITVTPNRAATAVRR